MKSESISAYSYITGAVASYMPGACDWEADVVRPTDEKIAKFFGVSVESIRNETELPENSGHKRTGGELLKAKAAHFAVKHPMITTGVLATAGLYAASAAGSTTAMSMTRNIHAVAAGRITYYAGITRPSAEFLSKLTNIACDSLLTRSITKGMLLSTKAKTLSSQALLFIIKHPILTASINSALNYFVSKDPIVVTETVTNTETVVKTVNKIPPRAED